MFQMSDTQVIHHFIRQHSFGMLVTGGDSLQATHIPMALNAEGTTLTGHLARGNRQWKTFDQAHEVLAIFQGPHHYISSSWHDHENVPTWNYLAAHVYGSIRVLSDDELYEALKALTDHYEQSSAHPVSMDKLSPAYVAREMRGTVGFRIDISRIEATAKLSQNRDDKNHTAIIAQLEQHPDAQARAIAEEMRRQRPDTGQH